MQIMKVEEFLEEYRKGKHPLKQYVLIFKKFH